MLWYLVVSPLDKEWGLRGVGGVQEGGASGGRARARGAAQDLSLSHFHTAGSAQHSTAQHSTARHSTAQHSTAQHSTAQHSTARHGTAQHSTAQSTAQHSTAQHSTAQRSAAQHSTEHSTTQRSTAQHSTAQHSTTQHSALSTPQFYPRAGCRVRSPGRQGPGTANRQCINSVGCVHVPVPSTIPRDPAAPSTGRPGPGNGQRPLARTADLASPSSPPNTPAHTRGPQQSPAMRPPQRPCLCPPRRRSRSQPPPCPESSSCLCPFPPPHRLAAPGRRASRAPHRRPAAWVQGSGDEAGPEQV